MKENPKELSALYEISQRLAASWDFEKTFDAIMDILSRELGMKRGTIALLDPKTNELTIEVAHGLSASAKGRGRYKIGEGVTGTVAATGQPVAVPRIGEEPLFLNRTRARGDITKAEISFICVPIKEGQTVVGALSVDRLFQNSVSLTEDVRLLTIIAAMIGQAVRTYRKVLAEKQALIDENIHLREELKDHYSFKNIVGSSSKMRDVFEMIHRVAGSQATVLIRGESGTGKELVAHAIHYQSDRAGKPFIKVNCAAIPEPLIESELFGYEKGAFTGALERKKGKFEAAEGGTIFLDEIGDLSPSTQAKLLRALQEREFERLGSTHPIAVDVRIIAATHKNLEEAVEQKTFRADLYYRLNVVSIFLPPLRERKEDIPNLADHFVAKFSKKNRKDIRRISTPAINMLMSYHWPGNVRELENAVERAVVICTEKTIFGHHLPPTLQTAEATHTRGSHSWDHRVDTFMKELLVDALKTTKGNRAEAARLLKTSERIIGYQIDRLGLNPKHYKPSR